VNPRPFAGASALAALLLFAACGAARAQGGDYFAIVDLDHDARISLAEYVERFSWAFRRMDRDRDGVLEPREQLVPGSPRLTLAEHEARLAAQFHKQDANKDGSLSRREFLAPPAR
jgi:Ca2+-binding EF-hand superfamily protein